MSFNDLNRVYELERKLFPNPWPRSFFETDLENPKTVALIAELEGEIVGYAMSNCVDTEFHITNIAVASEVQRQGIATQLMNEFEEMAKARGCTSAYLEVRVGNLAAIELYKKLGFNVLYIRKYYYLDGTDAYVMYKVL